MKSQRIKYSERGMRLNTKKITVEGLKPKKLKAVWVDDEELDKDSL